MLLKICKKSTSKDRAIQEKEGIDLEIEAIHPLTGQKYQFGLQILY